MGEPGGGRNETGSVDGWREPRSAHLRRQARWSFGLGLTVALAFHVLLLVFSPTFDTRPRVELYLAPEESDTVALTWRFVDVRFDSPRIESGDGSMWQEPPERFLEAKTVDIGKIQVSAECRRTNIDWKPIRDASVSLEVTGCGRRDRREHRRRLRG